MPISGLFGPGKAHYTLEQVDRRWSWFKRLLKYIELKFGTIFPAHWRLPLRLCLEFAARTKLHLQEMLTEMESQDRMDVHALLKALQSALRFESEMSDKFNLLQELQQVSVAWCVVLRCVEELNNRKIFLLYALNNFISHV